MPATNMSGMLVQSAKCKKQQLFVIKQSYVTFEKHAVQKFFMSISDVRFKVLKYYVNVTKKVNKDLYFTEP